MNPVVHFEIVARENKAALQRFYADTFHWKINTENAMGYGLVDNEGEGIGGGIDEDAAGGAGIGIYIQVDDPTAYLQRVVANGGEIVMPETDIGMIVMAKFRDPAGNIVGIVKAE